MAAFTLSQIRLSPSARILVALSGGPDSSALLIALCLAAESSLLPMPVGVAHFHHQLRGSDADADAAFAATLAATRAYLPCVVGLGSVAHGTGQSPNDAARRARYDFLIEAANDLGADTIATAHSLDDQAETVLGRVLRGTGLAGLAGIPSSRSLSSGISVIRPLLSQRRAAVEEFCQTQEISPRHDPSNDKDRYARSRLRKLMPFLTDQFNLRLADSLSRLANQAALDNDLLQTFADRLWQEAVEVRPDGLFINTPILTAAHPSLRSRVLLAAIRKISGDNAEAATSAFVTAIERIVENTSGEVHLPGGCRARCAGPVLILSRLAAPHQAIFLDSPTPIFSIPLPVPGTAYVPTLGLTVRVREQLPTEILKRERRSPTIDIAYNASDLASGALQVRSASSGDRISPLGMHGHSRLVRDILAEAGTRAGAPIVVDTTTSEIIWIVGLVQSESTRVTSESAYVLRLSAEWNTESL